MVLKYMVLKSKVTVLYFGKRDEEILTKFCSSTREIILCCELQSVINQVASLTIISKIKPTK